MNRLMPPAVVGACVGFVVGVLIHTGEHFWGLQTPGYMALVLGALGALGGGTVGAFFQSPSRRLRAIARWCAGMAVLFGGAGFLAGFAGPILLRPDLSQGPLLGFFVTGPLGTVAGAVFGAVLGGLDRGPSRPAMARVVHR
jgi:hypothetical protein